MKYTTGRGLRKLQGSIGGERTTQVALDRIILDTAGHLDYALRAMYDESAPFLDYIEALVSRVARA